MAYSLTMTSNASILISGAENSTSEVTLVMAKVTELFALTDSNGDHSIMSISRDFSKPSSKCTLTAMNSEFETILQIKDAVVGYIKY